MATVNPVGDRPEVRIDRSDVGRRVSVRRLAEFVDDRPVFRDSIGVLTSWDDHGLTIAPRSGDPVHLPEKLLVAGKVVPPFPVRRAPLPVTAPVELQRIAGRGWPAVEQEPLGEWTLRAAAGFTRRANSVQALGDPGLPLPRALAAVRAWYAARGLPAYVEVISPARRPRWSPNSTGSAPGTRPPWSAPPRWPCSPGSAPGTRGSGWRGPRTTGGCRCTGG